MKIYGNAGNDVTWTFNVKNEGNVALNFLTLSDSIGNRVTCNATALSPGDGATCTSTSQVTQVQIRCKID